MTSEHERLFDKKKYLICFLQKCSKKPLSAIENTDL